jgi:hypothetical protein
VETFYYPNNTTMHLIPSYYWRPFMVAISCTPRRVGFVPPNTSYGPALLVKRPLLALPAHTRYTERRDTR